MWTDYVMVFYQTQFQPCFNQIKSQLEDFFIIIRYLITKYLLFSHSRPDDIYTLFPHLYARCDHRLRIDVAKENATTYLRDMSRFHVTTLTIFPHRLSLNKSGLFYILWTHPIVLLNQTPVNTVGWVRILHRYWLLSFSGLRHVLVTANMSCELS